MRTILAFLLMSISLFSNAQTKINPARLLQGTSGSGSVFLKSDNSGNVSFSNNLNGGVLSGLGNGVLSSDAVNLGQLQGSVNGSIGYLAKFTGGNSVGNSLVYDNGLLVGIGTTSPISRLHVTTSSASTSYVTIGNINNGLLIGVAANGENQILNYASKGIIFGGNFNGTQTEQMRIASNGNVGIGTSSPSRLLHVEGEIRGQGLVLSTTGSNLYSIGANTNGLFLYNNTTGTNNIFIDNLGNVGIGTNTPTAKLDINGVTRLRGMVEFATNTDFTYNAYYSSGWKYRTSGYAADIYQGSAGDITFLVAPSGSADAPIPFVSTLRVLNSGGISVEGFKIQNVANATNANDAVNLSQAQNASNLTTGTIPDARISTNIARVSDLKLCNYTALTLPTQSTDYTLNFNWDNYAQNTYGVDGTGFSGTNILISGSNPKTGGFYNIIITNCGGRNLVFSSKFKNFDGVALSTINATSAMRFKFVFNGTDYMRID